MASLTATMAAAGTAIVEGAAAAATAIEAASTAQNAAKAGVALTSATVASGKQQAGAAKEASSEYTAQQLDQQAGATRATSQRKAEESRRQGQIASSNARAAGAAGGGAGSYDVADREAELQAEGEYAALVDMYEGEEAARGMETQAAATRYQGEQAAKAGDIGAAGTLLYGTTVLASKYGGGTATALAPKAINELDASSYMYTSNPGGGLA